MLEGIAVLIGIVGDAYDNAFAESAIGLFQTEVVSKSSPFLQGTIDDIEVVTMEWVDWFNTHRLHGTLLLGDGYASVDGYGLTCHVSARGRGQPYQGCRKFFRVTIAAENNSL